MKKQNGQKIALWAWKPGQPMRYLKRLPKYPVNEDC